MIDLVIVAREVTELPPGLVTKGPPANEQLHRRTHERISEPVPSREARSALAAQMEALCLW